MSFGSRGWRIGESWSRKYDGLSRHSATGSERSMVFGVCISRSFCRIADALLRIADDGRETNIGMVWMFGARRARRYWVEEMMVLVWVRSNGNSLFSMRQRPVFLFHKFRYLQWIFLENRENGVWEAGFGEWDSDFWLY